MAQENLNSTIQNEMDGRTVEGIKLLSPASIRTLLKNAEDARDSAPKNAENTRDSGPKNLTKAEEYFNFKYEKVKNIIATLIASGVYFEKDTTTGKLKVTEDSIDSVHAKQVQTIQKKLKDRELESGTSREVPTSIWSQQETYVKNIQRVLDILYSTPALPDLQSKTYKKPTSLVEQRRNQEEVTKYISKAIVENIDKDLTANRGTLQSIIKSLPLDKELNKKAIRTDNVLKIIGTAENTPQETKNLLAPLIDGTAATLSHSKAFDSELTKLTKTLHDQIDTTASTRDSYRALQDQLNDESRWQVQTANVVTGAPQKTLNFLEDLPAKLLHPHTLFPAIGAFLLALWWKPGATLKVAAGTAGVALAGTAISRLFFGKGFTTVFEDYLRGGDSKEGLRNATSEHPMSAYHNDPNYLKNVKAVVGEDRYNTLLEVTGSAKNKEQNGTNLKASTDELMLVSGANVNDTLDCLKLGDAHTISFPQGSRDYSKILQPFQSHGIRKLWGKVEKDTNDESMAPLGNALCHALNAIGRQHGQFVKELYPELKEAGAPYLGYIYLRLLYRKRDMTNVPQDLQRALDPNTPLYFALLQTLNQNLNYKGSIVDRAHDFIRKEKRMPLEQKVSTDLDALESHLEITKPKLQGDTSTPLYGEPITTNTASRRGTTENPPISQDIMPEPILYDIVPPQNSRTLETYMSNYPAYTTAELQAYITPFYEKEEAAAPEVRKKTLKSGRVIKETIVPASTTYTNRLRPGVHIMQTGYIETVANRAYKALVEKSPARAATEIQRSMDTNDVRGLIHVSENKKMFESPVSKERLYATVLDKILTESKYPLAKKKELLSAVAEKLSR